MHSLENNEPNVAYVEVRHVPLITPDKYFAGMGGGVQRTFHCSKVVPLFANSAFLSNLMLVNDLSLPKNVFHCSQVRLAWLTQLLQSGLS